MPGGGSGAGQCSQHRPRVRSQESGVRSGGVRRTRDDRAILPGQAEGHGVQPHSVPQRQGLQGQVGGNLQSVVLFLCHRQFVRETSLGFGRPDYRSSSIEIGSGRWGLGVVA